MAKLTLRCKKHKKSRKLQRKNLGKSRRLDKSSRLQRKSRRLQRKSRIQRGGTKETRFDEYYAEIKKCGMLGNETQGLCPSIMPFFSFNKNKLNDILTQREKDLPSLKQLICQNTDVRVVLKHETPYFLKIQNPLFPNENVWHKIITDLHRYVHNDPSDKPNLQKLVYHTFMAALPSAGTKTIGTEERTGTAARPDASRPSSTNPKPNFDILKQFVNKTESLPDGWVAGIDRDGIYYYVELDPTITSRTFPTTTGVEARLAALKDD